MNIVWEWGSNNSQMAYLSRRYSQKLGAYYREGQYEKKSLKNLLDSKSQFKNQDNMTLKPHAKKKYKKYLQKQKNLL